MDMRANAAGADSVEGKPEDKEPIDYESLGKLMRRVRKEHGLTQDQVVNIQGLNLDRSVYAKYESGKVRPSEEFIKRFAEHFHVKLDEKLKGFSHEKMAEKAAEYLQNHRAVKKVYYPGLPGAQGYEINKRQAKNGGAMISFELYENYNIKKFFKALKLVALAESLGGVESLVCHPASMTHASIPYEVRQKVGITDGLIRLSIGIENTDDILADLEQAIAESEE